MSEASRQLSIAPDEAARAVDHVVNILAAPATRGDIQGSYQFHPQQGGYGLWHRERCVLEVNGKTLEVRIPAGTRPPEPVQLELYVRALAPKLLFQRGITVLHASACLVGRQSLAFAGLSGAGKTTTASAFREAGALLLSEDLVVVAQSRPCEMFIHGEVFVRDWARELADRLRSDPVAAVSSESLAGIVRDETVRIGRIILLDRHRRRGTEFETALMSPPDALIAILSHDFLGDSDSPTWRRYLSDALALLETVEVTEGTAPQGVEELPSAASRYISRTAS